MWFLRVWDDFIFGDGYEYWETFTEIRMVGLYHKGKKKARRSEFYVLLGASLETNDGRIILSVPFVTTINSSTNQPTNRKPSN